MGGNAWAHDSLQRGNLEDQGSAQAERDWGVPGEGVTETGTRGATVSFTGSKSLDWMTTCHWPHIIVIKNRPYKSKMPFFHLNIFWFRMWRIHTNTFSYGLLKCQRNGYKQVLCGHLQALPQISNISLKKWTLNSSSWHSAPDHLTNVTPSSCSYHLLRGMTLVALGSHCPFERPQALCLPDWATQPVARGHPDNHHVPDGLSAAGGCNHVPS